MDLVIRSFYFILVRLPDSGLVCLPDSGPGCGLDFGLHYEVFFVFVPAVDRGGEASTLGVDGLGEFKAPQDYMDSPFVGGVVDLLANVEGVVEFVAGAIPDVEHEFVAVAGVEFVAKGEEIATDGCGAGGRGRCGDNGVGGTIFFADNFHCGGHAGERGTHFGDVLEVFDVENFVAVSANLFVGEEDDVSGSDHLSATERATSFAGWVGIFHTASGDVHVDRSASPDHVGVVVDDLPFGAGGHRGTTAAGSQEVCED